MKRIALILALILPLAISLPVMAAQQPTDSDLQILLEKVRADKKLLVAANMELTDAEAKKFWPLYDVYQKELKTLNARVAALINSYADDYNNDTMTDAKAKKMIREMIAIEEAEAAMKKSFVPKLYKALSAVKSARYLQIENKIRAALRYEVAGLIPLAK
jgi:hypothetical protein